MDKEKEGGKEGINGTNGRRSNKQAPGASFRTRLLASWEQRLACFTSYQSLGLTACLSVYLPACLPVCVCFGFGLLFGGVASLHERRVAAPVPTLLLPLGIHRLQCRRRADASMVVWWGWRRKGLLLVGGGSVL